jgi:hypothetical protein
MAKAQTPEEIEANQRLADALIKSQGRQPGESIVIPPEITEALAAIAEAQAGIRSTLEALQVKVDQIQAPNLEPIRTELQQVNTKLAALDQINTRLGALQSKVDQLPK